MDAESNRILHSGIYNYRFNYGDHFSRSKRIYLSNFEFNQRRETKKKKKKKKEEEERRRRKKKKTREDERRQQNNNERERERETISNL